MSLDTGLRLDDPADFGIWGRVLPGQSSSFRKWIAAELSMPELTAHQIFGRTVMERRQIPFYAGYGWLEIAGLLKNVPEFIEKESLAVSESDLKPGVNVDFCEIHNLFHRPLTCPVCVGNCIERGRRKVWCPP